jgi:hypothetical protein
MPAVALGARDGQPQHFHHAWVAFIENEGHNLGVPVGQSGSDGPAPANHGA